MAGIHCNKCGHHNPEGSNFCSSCGAILDVADGGDSTITFHPDRPADSPDDDVTLDLAEIPPELGVLVVKRGPKAGSRFLLERDTTSVCRHPDGDIFLDDVTVSRRHAEVVRTGQEYVVRDVGSLNGTYLNRERIDEADLHNGDELQVGKFRLVFFQGADGDDDPSS